MTFRVDFLDGLSLSGLSPQSYRKRIQKKQVSLSVYVYDRLSMIIMTYICLCTLQNSIEFPEPNSEVSL